MATYTAKALKAASKLTTSIATVYTVPGSTTAVLRKILVNNGASSITFTLALDTDAAGTRLFDAVAVPLSHPAVYSGAWVMATGKTVQAKSSSANTVLALYGFEYA